MKTNILGLIVETASLIGAIGAGNVDNVRQLPELLATHVQQET